MSFDPLAPGSTVGILGGGQLGRMLALAAARLGMKVHVYEPAPEPPAGQVANKVTRAAWDDADALADFAAGVDVVTYEFENVDLAAIDVLAPLVPVRPGRRALEVAQDRIAEKDFLNAIGLATAPYAAIDGTDTLETALEAIGTPSILKTRRLGYDGKGQVRLDAGSSADAAWLSVGKAPSVLEGFVDFEREISVIAARGGDGSVAAFDPGENEHRDGILHKTTVPARVPAGRAQDAVLLAGKILTELDYVGVIGVELFVTRSGLVVNEIAPRVHNSGHWTEAACLIDQFEQHIRAICGWPLGDGARHSDAEMVNLLGSDAEAAPGLTGARVHLYGKAEARPGRKMGHVTRIRPRGAGG
ncbi:5-(carboxyamino)imidazole ribonucleotide synthase [Amaricoccus macauensis]|uniref:N5-carboxyaminoimidazole ribonucleotide synthase n=1 Tax=Amaricoccus macauensis TaxID=57001 RepID=A0A840SN60_9RHOB|nr:5-(carboxyamino)imidazole ribonucleotide synthase [Amaricoccus macauensis]MBB5221306.1 5-(carboxyamino)imidazole ribonucleotide synthase [Amaricoccus macauensis]